MAWFDDVVKEVDGSYAPGSGVDPSWFGEASPSGGDDNFASKPGYAPSVPTLDTLGGTATGQAGIPSWFEASAPRTGLILPGEGDSRSTANPNNVSKAAAPGAPFDWGSDDFLSQFGDLNTPYPEFTGQMPQFEAPSAVNEANDPGFDARSKEGQKAIERAAAANGTLLTGGTLKGIQRYGEDYASNEYDKIYNRALQSYGANMQDFNTNRSAYEANRADFNANRDRRFNQAFSLASLGLGAAENENTQSSNYADTLARIYAGLGGSLSDLYTNQGNSNASGEIAKGNAGATALNSAGNVANTALLSQYLRTPQPVKSAAEYATGGGVTYRPPSTPGYQFPIDQNTIANQSTYNPSRLYFQ